MGWTLDQLEHEARQLPADEQARLAHRLLNNLDPARQAELDELWHAEAERRLHAIRSGQLETIPGEQAFSEAHAALNAES